MRMERSKNRVYIHTTIHILNHIIHTYALATLPWRFGGITLGKSSTHDFHLNRGEA